MAGTFALDAYQGEDISYDFALTDGGAPLDITGWSISFRVGLVGNESIITKTVGSGITVTDAANGELTIALTASDLTRINASYLCELRRTGTGVEAVLGIGSLNLKNSLFVSP